MGSLSKILLDARKNACEVPISQDDLPANLTQAYACSVAQVADVRAWKIGGANPWSQAVFKNSKVFFGPLEAREVFVEHNQIPIAGLVAPLVEPEVMLEIGDWSSENRRNRFPRMALGFEIPASVLPKALKSMLIAQVSDRAGAGAIWISKIQPLDEARISQGFEVEMEKNGKNLVVGHTENVISGPMGAAEEFLSLAIQHDMPLRSGQWIATGGLCPAVPVSRGDIVTLRDCNQIHRLEFI